MMRKFLTATLIVALFASCGGSSSKNTTESKEQEKPTVAARPTKLIDEIDGYFVTYKPKMVEVLIQNEADWNANFNVAKTMDNQPTTVDFGMHKVGVIVAPETDIETDIVIDNTSIKDRKLVVEYSINTKGEKQSFTIVPMKAFLYSITQDIDSVSFVNKGITTTLPK